MITIDFETRSACDLKKCGTSVYARHASTEVLCLAYGREIDHVQIWTPGDPPPEMLIDAAKRGVEHFEGHNVGFERNIWHHIMHLRHGWPDVQADMWRCSMAACCYRTLPRSLDGAGAALGLDVTKDKEGTAIMRRLCKPLPKKRGQEETLFAEKDQYDNDPEKFRKLYAYCIQDVKSEMALAKETGPLPAAEQKVWQLDQQINGRGLGVDREALGHAKAIVEQTYADCCREIEKLTGGKVQSPKQVQAIRNWIKEQMGESPSDLAAETVQRWLSRIDLPRAVAQMLRLRQQAAKASTAKITAMLQRCDEDGRVRGNLVYHGATTGRWAGSGIQIQNYPRGSMSPWEIEKLHEVLPLRSGRALDLLFGSPLECISSSLRSMVRAEEGKRLLVCDFASIEARVLAWIAGQADSLETFATGGDVYVEMAAKIYDVPAIEVIKPQRQVGKTAILGLGYGMGWKAFVSTCQRMAGVEIDSDMSRRVVNVYRSANDRIKALWGEVGSAAIRAIEAHKPHRVGRMVIDADEDWMTIQLPSGRKLHYRRPHLVEAIAPWSIGYRGVIYGSASLKPWLERIGVDMGERVDGCWIDCDTPADVPTKLRTKNLHFDLEEKEPQMIKQIQFWGVDSVSKKWGRQRTYSAKLVENITQAIARDFLVEAMFRCEASGYETVATVHDEILSERKIGEGSLEEFETLMKQIPKWGSGCPIEVEGYESERYKK